jgi:hypothetical protein
MIFFTSSQVAISKYFQSFSSTKSTATSHQFGLSNA